jgi:hypothetical protein
MGIGGHTGFCNGHPILAAKSRRGFPSSQNIIKLTNVRGLFRKECLMNKSDIVNETGDVIAIMGQVAEILWSALQDKGIEVERPDAFRIDDDFVNHFYIDIPVGNDENCRVLILRPRPAKSAKSAREA